MKIGVDIWFIICYNNQAPRETVLKTWGCSSPGRALEWHSRGKGFDPPHLHQNKPQDKCPAVLFCTEMQVCKKPLGILRSTCVQTRTIRPEIRKIPAVNRACAVSAVRLPLISTKTCAVSVFSCFYGKAYCNNSISSVQTIARKRKSSSCGMFCDRTGRRPRLRDGA